MPSISCVLSNCFDTLQFSVICRELRRAKTLIFLFNFFENVILPEHYAVGIEIRKILTRHVTVLERVLKSLFKLKMRFSYNYFCFCFTAIAKKTEIQIDLTNFAYVNIFLLQTSIYYDNS